MTRDEDPAVRAAARCARTRRLRSGARGSVLYFVFKGGEVVKEVFRYRYLEKIVQHDVQGLWV